MQTPLLANHTQDYQFVHQCIGQVVALSNDAESFKRACATEIATLVQRQATCGEAFMRCAYEDLCHALDDLSHRWIVEYTNLPSRHFAASLLPHIQQQLAATLAWPARRYLLVTAQILDLLTASPNARAIPKIIHLMKTDGDPHRLEPINFWSIKSILDKHPDYDVVLHTPLVPQGERWSSLLPRLQLNVHPTPQRLANKPLQLAAHQADVWRVEKLLEHGGFYFDWDMLLLKSVEDLREHFCVLGLEHTPQNHNEALGVAAIGARANSVFLKCWQTMMADAYKPDQYLAHSVTLTRQIAEALPASLNVLAANSFYEPGWTAADMAWWFEPTHLEPYKALERKFEHSWGVHFFESNASFQAHAHKVPWSRPRAPSNNFERLLHLAQL